MYRLGMAVVVLVALAAGCGGSDDDAAEAPSSVDLVVIGDSLINPTGVCPGCTGFVEQYASALEEEVGAPATAQTVPAGNVPEAQQIVAEDEAARSVIAGAEVVVLQVGYNNALPDPETGIGCGGSLGGGYVSWLRTTEPSCLAEGVATYGQLYDEIFAGIKDLRGDEPTIFITTNSLDGNIDPSDSQGLLGVVADDDLDEVRSWTVAAYDRWNDMLAERAEAAGFVYVDLYHEFNGPDGSQPFGELSTDGAHPSQLGHDLISSKLEAVELSAFGL